MAETEDIPYTAPDFATPDEEQESEEVVLSKDSALVKAVRKYLQDAIKNHSSFDVINLPANATPEQKIAAFDDMAIHKGLVMHLRSLQQVLNNIIEENQ